MASCSAGSSRLALLLLLVVGSAGVTALPVRASSPQAWSAYGQQVQRACIAASTLRNPVAVGERVDLPGGGDGLISALVLRGTYPQPHMAGRRGQELCLYDSRTRQARVAEADRLIGTTP